MLAAFVTTTELALVVLSAFLHAIWSASIKGSRNPLGFNLLQLAPPVAAACVLPLWVPLGDVPRAVWWIAIGTGVSHGFYFYWLARALESGELSVVYPIARSAPAFLPLVAVPLLGESVTARGALGIAVVVAGMWAVQADAGVVGWQRFRAPGAKYAWLTLLASIGYSLCDKAAMARLNSAPMAFADPASRRLLRDALDYRRIGLRATRIASRLARRSRHRRTQRVAQRVSRRGGELRELWADPARIANGTGVLCGRGAPDQRALRRCDRRDSPARATEPAARARRKRDRIGRRHRRELSARYRRDACPIPRRTRPNLERGCSASRCGSAAFSSLHSCGCSVRRGASRPRARTHAPAPSRSLP